MKLTGDYTYLEDAWTGIMMHAKSLKLKANKNIAPYEKYVTNPMEVKNPEEYITEVVFPIK